MSTGPHDDPAELLRRTETAAFWRELAPGLADDLGAAASGDRGASPEAAAGASGARAPEDAAGALHDEGLVVLPGLADVAEAARVAEAVARLVAEGLPATFVYAYDAPWRIARALRARLEPLVGDELVALEDFWAFHVPPGARGWPPHRGNAGFLQDRHAPELVNTWVAMTDVSADRSALAFVPLDDDPGYPDDLRRVDAPLHAVRAVPVAAGVGLAWNANVLHWGGPSSRRAAGPRVSLTYSFVRRRAAPRIDYPVLDAFPSTLAARCDAIARQILAYGRDQPDVSDGVRRWAQAAQVLARLRSA